MFISKLLALVPAACALNFSSSPAADLQNYFFISSPWLGADISTSVQLNTSTYLWLHGDTLYGGMNNGVRNVNAMPRNSVGLLNVADGVPVGPYRHYMRVNTSDPVHFGFWSPANASQWYWPTAGINVLGQVYVIAYRTENANPGSLFPFATAGIDILTLNPSGSDPLSWPAPSAVTTLPVINNSFTLGNAVAMSTDGAYVYMMGSSGPNGQTAMVARIPTASWAAQAWEQLMYWTSAGTWQAYSPTLPIMPLFDFMPSETTLTWHPTLSLWYLLIVNTFVYGPQVMIRTAQAVTGPWSEAQPIYTIPQEQMAGGAFCYAPKSHPELVPPSHAQELLWTYMCNTPTIPELLNRTDVYCPQVVRTSVTA